MRKRGGDGGVGDSPGRRNWSWTRGRTRVCEHGQDPRFDEAPLVDLTCRIYKRYPALWHCAQAARIQKNNHKLDCDGRRLIM
eukprot:7715902-Pyramimonas_sp.AAC.1